MVIWCRVFITLADVAFDLFPCDQAEPYILNMRHCDQGIYIGGKAAYWNIVKLIAHLTPDVAHFIFIS